MIAYLHQNSFRLLCALLLVIGLALGLIDPATAALGGLIVCDTTSAEELFRKVLGEHSAAIKDFTSRTSEEVKTLRAQIVELAQRGQIMPGYSGGSGPTPLAETLMEASGFKDFQSGRIKELNVAIPGGFGLSRKTQIVNASGASQPLVEADRLREIVYSPPRALRLRDLIPALPTESNTIEFPSEASFTNSARPQGDVSPVGIGESEELAESAMTFSLSSAAVVTIGHWIPLSQQVLTDSQALADHLENRLIYGLKLKEETDILTGTGGANTLNGLNNQATAYNRGATNDTLLDTLMKARTQLQLNNCEPDGVILHPDDFLTMATSKDVQLRYLWSDPAGAMVPTVWGTAVIVSNSQTSGRFTMGDFRRAARIWDRGQATVEFSTSHENFFIKLMVACRAWERIALTVLQPTALIYGNTVHSG